MTETFETRSRFGGMGRLAIALAVVAIWLLITIGGIPAPPDNQVSLKEMTTTAIAWKTFSSLAFLLLAAQLLDWNDLGLRMPDWRSVRRLFWLPLLHLLAMAAFVAATGEVVPQAVLFVVINMIGVGIAEELAFRGVLWGAARKTMPFWPAFLFVSGVFGIVHMANVPATGDLQGSIVQSIAAVLSGIGYLALRIRCRSLLPVMALHCVWNILVLGFSAPADPAVSLPFLHQLGFAVALVLPMFLYGLWLVRNEKVRAGWRTDHSG